jgi:hypothetical protein
MSCGSHSNVDVRTVLKNYLLAVSFDGLSNPHLECGCTVDDLAPCASDCLDCIPGHRQYYKDRECPCGEHCQWHIVPGRRP